MERAFRQTCPREVLVRWDGWELHCLLALIGLTGTDYSRGLPYVGPRKVWSMLPKILPVLTSECMRTREGQPFLEPEVTARFLYAAIYANAFSSHVRDSGQNFAYVMGALNSSKLSTRTKASLPSFSRATCTARNANFILDYWLGKSPDSMESKYGFREANGLVEWDE